jgi:glyoxylase I family protein
MDKKEIPPSEVRWLIKGVDHPAVAAENVDALADWYCTALGFEKLFRDDRPIWLLKAPDGVILEILPNDGKPRPERGNLTLGWSHVAFKVYDIEAGIAHLDTFKVVWTSPLSPATGGGQVRTFKDIEGNTIQLVQRSPLSPEGGMDGK